MSDMLFCLLFLVGAVMVSGQTYIHSVSGYGNTQACSGGSPSDSYFVDGDCLTTFAGSANVTPPHPIAT
jgi:hypothetical protein